MRAQRCQEKPLRFDVLLGGNEVITNQEWMNTVRPSRVLTIYCALTFAAGVALTVLVAFLQANGELGTRGGAIVTLCWNVLFILILPLVLDWSESKHFKARFLKLEEVAASNPELASVLSEQCEKHSLSKLRLAVVDTPSEEVFSYGLAGSNPRLVVSGTFFNEHEKSRMVPSIEAELSRVKAQGQTVIFLLFTVLQVALQHLLAPLLHI